MLIERNTYTYTIHEVGELERGDVFELMLGSNVGTPFLKTSYENEDNTDEIVCFNIKTNEECYIAKKEKCFLGINAKVKYDLQIYTPPAEE